MTLRESALDYCRRGWSVIPLRFEGSIEDRKRPLVESWEPNQKLPATEEQVTAWWQKWPTANVGIVMGAVSGLVALDLDGPNAVELLRAQHIFLPRTVSSKTGKGYHALYRHPGSPVPNRAALLSDGHGSAVDVRGDGGYCVAPPSIHGSGHVYQWVVPPDEGIAEMPPELVALVLRRSRSSDEPADGAWVDGILDGVPEGQRNETAARLAGYWLRVTDGNMEATQRAMRLWGVQCTPPMDLKELRATVGSIARRERAQAEAEAAKGLSRIPVVEGPQWADELATLAPRQGTPVDIPGASLIGGLVPGDLVVVAGRPGAGKSTLGAQLCVRACFEARLPTLIVSTEMTRGQWGRWMASVVSGMTTAALPHPLPTPVLAWWRTSPISIIDAGQVAASDIRTIAQGRLGLKLVIVDHLGRIGGPHRESRVLEVGHVARALKSLAKDLQCTVVTLCQLNRRVEGADEKEPRLDDLRESGEIEQEADSVVFLWTDEKDRGQAKMPGYATVAKNRHGPTGKVRTIFDKAGRQIVGGVLV